MSNQAKSAPNAATSKPATSASTTAGAAKSKGVNTNQLVETIQTLQFAWFVGHVLTLWGIFLFTLTFIRSGSRFHRFWYQLALFGIIESFGILLYQLITKKALKVNQILKDDNTQYFLLGSVLLLIRPYVLIPLLPFALFSLFHVLAYTKGYLLPIFGMADSGISKQIENFISKNNTKSIQVASLLEIYSFLWLTVRVILFRKRSLIPWVFYAVFLKMRYEKSIFTRNYFKSMELQLDEAVNKINNPAVKDVWIKAKGVIRSAGGIYLVNDYTKEKLN
ncbi:unnamed protein product [Debaryomyces tyrocola]|nr:unnamed protein product [Debaryomyces tyrocola]